MTKTLVDIPDDLMEAARAVIGKDATKAETVRTALQEMVRRHQQRTAVDWFTGTDVVADLRDPEVRASARR
jgi:NifU-like protein involved in Fe-S cluster formation